MWTDVEIFNAKCGDTCLIDIDIILNPHNRSTNSVYAQIPSLIPNQWVGNQNKDNSDKIMGMEESKVQRIHTMENPN